MSTLISNPKVNDESLRGHVEPMPPPPALALAHEVWRANRDGDTAAARDALEKLTALAERRVVPTPINASSAQLFDPPKPVAEPDPALLSPPAGPRPIERLAQLVAARGKPTIG